MPTLLAFRPLRLLCDLANPNHVREQRTGLPPVIARGTPTVIQIALALDRSVCSGVADLLQSITIEVRASADPDLAPLIAKTLAVENIDDDLTQTTWDAKTAQHAAFELTGQECNIEAGDKWLTVWFTKAGGDSVACAFGKIKVTEDGAGDPDEAIANETDHYTKTEADGRFATLGPCTIEIVNPAWRVKWSEGGGFLQLKDSDDALFHSIWLDSGALQIGPGDSELSAGAEPGDTSAATFRIVSAADGVFLQLRDQTLETWHPVWLDNGVLKIGEAA